MDKIREPLLRELIRSQTRVRALIKGTEQAFSLIAFVGESERVLETARGRPRLFASLDTAAQLVQSMGLQHFEVDMSTYQPGRLRKARPDRAEALRKTRTRMRQETLGI